MSLALKSISVLKRSFPGPLYRILFENESVIRDVTIQAFSTLVFRLMAELGNCPQE